MLAYYTFLLTFAIECIIVIENKYLTIDYANMKSCAMLRFLHTRHYKYFEIHTHTWVQIYTL